jgi:hypothetical protein
MFFHFVPVKFRQNLGSVNLYFAISLAKFSFGEIFRFSGNPTDRNYLLLDQQRDVIVEFWLDVFCLLKARAPEFNVVYSSTAALVFQ